ncbi:Gametolysin peptidase M11 [Legionella busanensis]|uniref:Gametolysin peptidase M11 n=1 Tax=Legionella busanensis TaxID=190655 RepID=A0A378JIL6_9GAMM|nr:Gametolysin peptidase M11 [Legionella busanensis]
MILTLIYQVKPFIVFLASLDSNKEVIVRQLKYIILSFFLSCSTLALAQTYQGELEVLIFDYFDSNKAKTIYQLHEANEVYKLDLPNSIDKSELLSGNKVIIEGEEVKSLLEKVIKVNSLTVQKNQTLENSPQVLSLPDIRKLLTLIVNFKNMQATANVSISDVDSILFTSLQSTRRNLLRSSFNQVNLLTDPNGDGHSDIYVINLDYDATNCNYDKWASDAKNAAAQSGINLALYRHFMFVLPQAVNCGWGGLGQLGCGIACNTWVKAYDPTRVYSKLIYTHEFGHNLGMHHAATDTNNDGVNDSEYGDAACIMGSGDSRYYKEVNAPHRDQMRWFDSYPERIATVTSGSYVLNPLEVGLHSTGLLALKVKKNATDTYYISYRRNRGLFGPGAPSYIDRISIHWTRAGDTHTYFIRTLNAGETFVDAANNVNITAVMTGGATAMVSVNQ